MKSDEKLDKNILIAGPPATSKTTIVKTFVASNKHAYDSVFIPLTCSLTIDKLKAEIESKYEARRKNFLEVKNTGKKVLLIIDDLHLHNNTETNFLEFIRTWSISRGYFDIRNNLFKNVADFGSVMIETSA